MKPPYFRWFIAAMACSAVCGVFCFETPIAVRLAAQRGNASAILDFRAFTEDGQPVVDLKADEVVIKVDGKERAVSSLRFIQSARKPGACRRPLRRTSRARSRTT
jgi:hypothetical protein